MIKIQQCFSEINKDLKFAEEIDLNTDREKAKEVINRLYENIKLMKDEIEHREGLFNPICKCLCCHKNGLVYEFGIYKTQKSVCHFCNSKHKVRLYKKGTISIILD